LALGAVNTKLMSVVPTSVGTIADIVEGIADATIDVMVEKDP
jgi:3-polyprenyl-4-hydroxybenzoate decarboxylase